MNGGTRPPTDCVPSSVDANPGVIRLELPVDARVVRVARLVASGLAATVGFDIDEVDDLRLAVGELCSVLFEVGDGKPLNLTFSFDDQRVHVLGETPTQSPSTFDRRRFALSEQILEAACDGHSWGVDDGVARFALYKNH
jgi:serine/threonine-protein kinase RsbW